MKEVFGKTPNVFTIPAGASFLSGLWRGLEAIQNELKIQANEITVLMPTRRAIRAFQEHVLKETGGRPVILPALRPLGDIDEDDLALENPWVLESELNLDPAVPAMQRRFLLQEELKALEGHPGLKDLTTPQRLMLADELARLFDQMQEQNLSQKALENLVAGDLASHWQDILSVLHVVTKRWPQRLAREGLADPVARRTSMIDTLIATWKQTPPERPVIAAGSTGSKRATRRLLRAVAGLPLGAVVLPGLDTEMEPESWDVLRETHPQFAMKLTLADMNLNRGKVRTWPFCEKPGGKVEKRLKFFREALRPPETTGGWNQIDVGAREAIKTFSAVECPTPRIEAGTIALIMRQTLETPGKTAALITPDRTLAGRVREELKRWNLEVDDSAGVKLTATPPGTYFALLAETVAGGFSPVSLLSFLKHPLTTAGLPRNEVLSLTRVLDMSVLRGARPGAGLSNLIAAVRKTPNLKSADKLVKLLENLQKHTSGFETAVRSKTVGFKRLLDLHIAAAEALAAAGDGDPKPLWQKAEGERLAAFVEDLERYGSSLGAIPGDEYPGILRSLMETASVRRPFGTHPRLFIWGALEARLQNPDVAILGGLNEGSWPPEPGADPWMSREMRRETGLPTADFRIGQAAHDFYLCAGANEIILTRAGKVEGTPTTPSRWLQRIRALLGDRLPGSTHPWAEWYASLDEPDIDAFVSIAPPRPKPPTERRPEQLSVTGVELLMRDPYAVYAKYILGLTPLDDLELDPTAADRGILLHEIFETFMRDCKGRLPPDPLARLLETGEEVFSRQGFVQPSIRAFWWPRFVEVAKAFVALQKIREKTHEVAALETKGLLEIGKPEHPFTLTAKADRIDKARDGSGCLVIDYKTGGIPGRREVQEGRKPQLPLEAVILEAGGFEAVGKQSTAGFEFWNVGKPGDDLDVTSFVKDIPDYVRDAREGLIALIKAFADDSTPYLATPDPANPGYGDYDPLSRLAEWRNKSPGEDEDA